MASQPPLLPPSALAGASAQAKIDRVAVRLIFAPDGARNSSEPTKITGTVSGQNSDGSLNIKTDKGDVRILLKDRGSLPQGLKIDIEIPAGRNPQQATIRTSEATQAQQPPQQPSLAQTLQEQQSTRHAQTAPYPSSTKLQAETLEKVITSYQAGATPDKAAPIPYATGTLQPGQIIRLLPVPPNSLPPQIEAALLKPSTVPEMISNLVNMIENLSKGQTQLRTTLITLLSRLDFSALKPALTAPSLTPTVQPNGLAVANPMNGSSPSSSPLPVSPLGPPLASPLSPATGAITTPLQTPLQPSASNALQPPLTAQLIPKINALVQSIGLQPPFQTPDAKSPVLPAPTTSSVSLFNPSKSVDGQILAIQNPILSPSSMIVPSQQSASPFAPTTPVSTSQIVGFSDKGLPILSVPLPNTGLTQLYTMQFKADNLSVGTPVFIALDPTSTKPTQIVFVQAADGTIQIDQNITKNGSVTAWINSGTWDSLDDLMKNLSHFMPAQGQAAMQMMPSPAHPNNMGALSLFFLSMMRSGDIDSWLPSEATNLLRQIGKSDVLRNVTSDMNMASRLENYNLPQDWRMTFLPLLWQQQIHKTPLYYKHLPDDEDKEGDEARKRRRLRFLFDLNMSRMGGVQVDGFMQSERLDIILRTKSPLSVPMQHHMKKLYAGAVEKSRLTGELSFQFKPEQWVDLGQFQGDISEKSGLQA